jgi:hypothetical protein
MKILFLYTKIDNALKEKIAQLVAHNAEVSTLSLLEYKLEENGEISYLEPQSKLEFLEKNSGKLRLLNRIFKRKKLLDKLEDYDIIDVYKCEKSALFIVDEIREKCYDFFVTVSHPDSNANIVNRQFYKYLYDKARFLIFESKALLEDFPYDTQEKERIIYTSIPMLSELDDISEEEIFKASYAMGFDLDKDIIYCDMSGTLQTQLHFIDNLLQLPMERLRQSTFIFHLNAHSLDERTRIKAHMQEKNFDYLLIETLITPKQSALLYKIADKSIILSDSKKTYALALSLYAKNHTYLYGDIMIDPIYHDKEFFIDTFANFQNHQEDENLIIKDLLQSNHDKIALYFSPQESINRYIEVIKEV